MIDTVHSWQVSNQYRRSIDQTKWTTHNNENDIVKKTLVKSYNWIRKNFWILFQQKLIGSFFKKLEKNDEIEQIF